MSWRLLSPRRCHATSGSMAEPHVAMTESKAARQGRALLAKPRAHRVAKSRYRLHEARPSAARGRSGALPACEKLRAQGAAGRRVLAQATACAAAGRTEYDSHRGERQPKRGRPARFLQAAPRTAVSGSVAGGLQSQAQAQSRSAASRPPDLGTRPEAAAAVQADESQVTFAAWAFSLSSRSLSWVHARMDKFRAAFTGAGSALPAGGVIEAILKKAISPANAWLAAPGTCTCTRPAGGRVTG